MIGSRILRQLNAVDWDFPAEPQGTLAALHWYPGTYPPQIPGTLIEALTTTGDTVVDPYGGIGTTAVEALRRGRNAWAIEHNPVAMLTGYVAAGLALLRQREDDRSS